VKVKIGSYVHYVQVVLVPDWHMYSNNQSGLILPSLPLLSPNMRSSVVQQC